MKQSNPYFLSCSWFIIGILLLFFSGCDSSLSHDPVDPIITDTMPPPPPIPCDTNPALILLHQYLTPVRVYIYNVGDGVIIDDTINAAVYFSAISPTSFEVTAGSLTDVVTLSSQTDSTYTFSKSYGSPHYAASAYFNCVTDSCSVFLRKGSLGSTQLAKAKFKYK